MDDWLFVEQLTTFLTPEDLRRNRQIRSAARGLLTSDVRRSVAERSLNVRKLPLLSLVTPSPAADDDGPHRGRISSSIVSGAMFISSPHRIIESRCDA